MSMLLHIIFFSLFVTFPFAMSLGTLDQVSTNTNNNISKPNCPTRCGNITVPYPFGVGKDTNCAIDNSFHVTCNTSYKPPKLFLRSSEFEIHSISDSEVRIGTDVVYRCYSQNGTIEEEFPNTWSQLSEFTFSAKNKFTVVGCDDYAFIKGTKGASRSSSGCVGICSDLKDVTHNGLCSGMGCCQTSIPKGLKYYNFTLETVQRHKDVWSFNPCGLGFMGEEGSFEFRGASDLSNAKDVWDRIRATVPVVVDWAISLDTQNCSACKESSSCYEVDGGGYRCRCNNGYVGNPYLDPGCQDINECQDPRTYPCYGDCINISGGYNCTCPSGSYGDAKIENGCQHLSDSKFSSTIFLIAMALGLLAILSAILAIFYGIRRRKLMKLREKFFEKNGGVLLQQKINSQGSHEAMTLFSIVQLQKATNNYSRENIIGRGAYGVVYKGVLDDKRVVAIKKSKIMDESQAEQFINEVLILTQVIHRNVVKLIGCCLEAEVPLLVYEFISNNTLFHHIHSRLGGMSWLSYENRLRVATEAATALAYLHSETIMPIIHRDIKSTNILLDDNYTAKISDFGASRLVSLDQQHVTTLIQGTLGYLDPEYFNTSQLTEKSDVYSFGVVLAEIITGNKAVSVDRSNVEKNLSTYFVNSVTENRLFEIVDPRILREGTFEQIQAVGDLVKRCLSSLGKDRPTMKEVVVELDKLRKFTTHPWVQQKAFEDTISSVREVEQSDLYEVPLVSYHTSSYRKSYSSSTN